jgi:hypothetical protein
MKHRIIPSHYFTVKEQSLVSLFCQGKKRFVIPYNQRPWSWKERNISELWNDIKKTTNSFFHASTPEDTWTEREEPISDAHFIGAFVFEEKDNDFSVVDGQQRLTSITMIVAALRNETEAIAMESKGTAKKTVKHFLDKYKSWLISDFSDDIISTRLKIDDNYIDFFSNYIVEAVNERERQEYLDEAEIDFSSEPILNSFKKSFDFVSKTVGDYLASFKDEKARYKAVKAIFSIIEECFICIAADVKKESFSYEVFKCLNAKGLPLSEADKLKNELFTQSSIREHEKIKEFWDLISNNTPYSAVASFIRQRHVALFGECLNSKLHSVITDKELINHSIPVVIKNWAEDSDIFSRVTLHKKIIGKHEYSAKELKYLSDLKNLGIGLSSILTFAAHKKYFNTDRVKFLELLRVTRNFCFRVLTVTKKDTSHLENHLGKAARMVMAGESVKDVRSSLKPGSPNAEFEEAFSSYSTSTAKQQFYILESIESHRLINSGLVPREHGEKLNVEHIMPKKDIERKTEWLWARTTPELHKQHLNRIGNLCLLEGDINKDVASFDYKAKRAGEYLDKNAMKKGNVKRKCYQDSELPMVKEIVNKYKEWSFEAIQERQKSLATEALKVWTLDALVN